MTKNVILVGILAFLTLFVLGQHHTGKYVPETDPLVIEKLEEWQDLKFGLLMHWGAYSQWGIVESWSICAEDVGWCRRKHDDYELYKKEYEQLKETFNPTKFKPEKWAKAASKAGMKYVVFTTKHHDGFSMFDTKYTDYKITDVGCPFHTHPRSNIALEIFNAFRDKGMWAGAYFSKPDWHSNDYWWSNFATPDRNVNYNIEKYPERWESFITFTHNQLMELVTDYGDLDILWLDGGWVAPSNNQDIRLREFVRKAREKQPGLIVVDRAVPGINQNYLTPENQVPEKMLPYPWESCIIAGGSWSWVPNANYMSGRKAIHLLVDIVSKGGNLLLNIAPGPEGTWHDEAYDLLDEIGEWMAVNSVAIYETRAIKPYKEGKVCLTRKNDGRVYLIYLAEEVEEKMPAVISLMQYVPKSNARITMPGTDALLKWEENGTGMIIHIPESLQKRPPSKYAWVFEIVEK